MEFSIKHILTECHGYENESKQNNLPDHLHEILGPPQTEAANKILNIFKQLDFYKLV